MAKKVKKAHTKRPIESYEHRDKQRVNIPPVGLVTPDTDPDAGAMKTYAFDPHLDPQLQWAGKAEHTSFQVPTVSLHVHERVDPHTIIEAVKRRNGSRSAPQIGLFETEREEPLRQAVEFYKHAHGWSNRMVAGDSLLVMNSLLEKEGMAGKVQMVYLDPPYGIRYGSNFQPFVNNRNVKDGKDEDLTTEPEQIRAFRDTWELGIHSYLTYLRDRLLLARELLTDSGSIFVQIGDDNLHHVRELMDEVFGSGNHVAIITVAKTSGASSPTARTNVLASVCDFLVWYAKDVSRVKYRALYRDKRAGESGSGNYRFVELRNGTRRDMTKAEYQNPSLVNTKPTASGRVTRRASSDPACCGGKRSRFPFRGRPFRARKENLSMHDWQSLAHVRWECKYHVVIIPKFRRKILYGQLRKQVGRILRALCDQRGVELLEGKAMADHVHLCLSIPPKYSVAHTVGFLKGKSAVQIHRKLLRERRMTGLHFWSTGYCVSTVGLDEGRIREYIREQEQLEAGQGDLDLK